MKFEITYPIMFVVITLLWSVVRIIINNKKNRIYWMRELQLLLVWFCIVVISRIVYFPWHHVNGHIDFLRFDSRKIFPLCLNLVPIVHLFDIYDGWQMNIIGNITMFIPVGIVWPVCFKQLDNIGKVVLAGFGYSLCIEISQLLFYERASDVDDLILNTTGVLIGALIYFGVVVLRRLLSRKRGIAD